MAISIALVVLLSLAASHLFGRFRLPGLVGILLVGVLLGPAGLNMLSPALLSVSTDFRRVALVVILLRAGLMLSRATVNRMGARVLLMALLPSLLEIAAISLVAPLLLGLSRLDSALLGAVLAAVSPAVVVPAMLDLIARREGEARAIPTLVLAASPLDNVLVIIIFTSLLSLHETGASGAALKLGMIPLQVLTGTLAGLLLGQALHVVFERLNPRATKRVLAVIGLALLLVAAEDLIRGKLPFSGLMAVMALGLMILERSEEFAHEISAKLAKVWILAEILLFALVGAMVDPATLSQAGLVGAGVLLIGLVARSLGVLCALVRSPLSLRERLFCVIAFLPKATVQAAVGATPLAAGLPGGQTILALAVLSIVITAPAGAVLLRWGQEALLPAPEP